MYLNLLIKIFMCSHCVCIQETSYTISAVQFSVSDIARGNL